MSEEVRISDKGIILATEVLVRDGFYPSDSSASDLFALKAACERYIKASKALGDIRTYRDRRDAVLIAYFEAYLVDVTRKLN